VSSFGVKLAYGTLERVLMHRPGEELLKVTEDTLAEFHFRRPVDRDQFVADYDGMLKLFQSHGVETLLLTDILKNDNDALNTIRHRPNMTYSRDLAAVFKGGAVLMGPHLKGRWGDQWIVGRALERLGVPVLGSIDQPGFLEGGGVTLIGEKMAATSLCDRANEAGTRALRELILGKEVKQFLEVPLPYGNVHIDGLFMVLDEKLCVIYEPAFEVFPCRLYEDGHPGFRNVMFTELLDELSFTCISATKEEKDAGLLNIVVTKQSEHAIGFAGATRIGSEMAKHGIILEGFPADEMWQGNGGAHCMTCPLLIS
tara:strand:- start:8028 stop:8966 length:939 start_codon:yes stop_codon:yes gene_type:complete